MMPTQNGRLQGKTALITGAANGIGLAITRLFSREGARIGAVSRQEASLSKLADIANVVPLKADITRQDDITRLVATAERQIGPIDILCNVAGINDLCYPLDETSDALWESVIDLDLTAPFRLCRAVLPGMVQRHHGVILNVASYAATRGNHGASYSAAKHGLIGLTQHTAVFYARSGIRCNAINPGGVQNTQISSNSGGTYHPQGFQIFLDIVEKFPVPWLCEPEDIAPTALFLCSDDSKHLNGAIIAVDGGMSAC